jgi:formate dehydrogenase beta subunit
VIVLGGGNTAMDCCRTSRRLGGEDVKVIVRSGFEEMKASPWEKEDAMHEDIPILNFLVPKEFTHDNGKLTGVTFEKVEGRVRRQGPPQLVPTGEPDVHHRVRRRAGRGRPGERLPLDRARHRHRVRQVGHAGGRSKTMQSTNPKVFFGGDAAFGPKNIIWAVAHGHEAAISIDKLLPGEDVRPPAAGGDLVSQKMGIHEWSYDNDISNDLRYKVPLRDKARRWPNIKAEVELGFDPKLAFAGGRSAA